MSNIVKFQNTPVKLISHNEDVWVTGMDIGKALGFSNPRVSVQNLFQSHKDEFNGDLTSVIETVTEAGPRKTRVFNRRGAHLLAMFAKTPRAKAFRRWVLDVLEDHLQKPLSIPSKLLKDISDSRNEEHHWKQAFYLLTMEHLRHTNPGWWSVVNEIKNTLEGKNYAVSSAIFRLEHTINPRLLAR